MFAPGFPAAAASPRSPRLGLLVLAERLLDGGCFGLALLGWGDWLAAGKRRLGLRQAII